MYTDENKHFYELEPAVVLDVILDENHPIFKTKTVKLDYTSVPDNFENKPALSDSIDYSWIGRILVRPLVSLYNIDKDDINDWAIPMENTGIVEYPLVNEVVIVGRYFKKLYYFRKLNIPNGFLNNNADFSKERSAGPAKFNLEKRTNPNDVAKKYQGPESILVSTKYATNDDKGALGRYFVANKNIRTIKKYEGDTVIESRFGQSIRFSAYDSNRDNDVGEKKYRDYYNKVKNPYTNKPSGGGNPMILIRNRQRPIQNIDTESNPGGFISEDINNDGSSIHITSGLTQSPFVTTVKKRIFQSPDVSPLENPAFSPNGSTKFIFPSKLIGDQIVINSDRLIFSSKNEETFHFSKKRYAIATDDEYTVDAENQVVITSNTKTVLNSPVIYLGEYNQTNEPAVLGQTLVDWLYDLCNWLLEHKHGNNHLHPHPHVHTHPHIHPNPHVHEGGGGSGVSGPPIPSLTEEGLTLVADEGTTAALASISSPTSIDTTKTLGTEPTLNAVPVNTLNAVPTVTEVSPDQMRLRQLRDSLGIILSKRVFLTGGGYAPGLYPSVLTNTVINPYTGEGVPGGYKSAPFGNVRGPNPLEIHEKFFGKNLIEME